MWVALEPVLALGCLCLIVCLDQPVSECVICVEFCVHECVPLSVTVSVLSFPCACLFLRVCVCVRLEVCMCVFAQVRPDVPLRARVCVCVSAPQTPTPIQMQCIPVVQSGRDVLCLAETGSGKTLAYCLPLVAALQDGGKPPSACVPECIYMRQCSCKWVGVCLRLALCDAGNPASWLLLRVSILCVSAADKSASARVSASA